MRASCELIGIVPNKGDGSTKARMVGLCCRSDLILVNKPQHMFRQAVRAGEIISSDKTSKQTKILDNDDIARVLIH